MVYLENNIILTVLLIAIHMVHGSLSFLRQGLGRSVRLALACLNVNKHKNVFGNDLILANLEYIIFIFIAMVSMHTVHHYQLETFEGNPFSQGNISLVGFMLGYGQ